ncbi:MAG: release factor H-coupled RctB family protein [Thermosipho sp. (in: thermotogales)]|nr:release factor H-coupled RctB family protein [Thermosipho sp. (in: thermotogales)]
MLQNEFSKKFYFVAKKIIWNNFGELNPGGHFIEFHILEKIYEESLKSLNNNSLLLIVHNGSGNYGKKLLVLLAQMFGYFEGNKLNLQDIPKIEDKIHQVYIPFWNHSISRGKNGNKNWLMFLELYKNILEYSFLNRLYIAEQVIDFLSQEFNHSIKFDFVSDSIHSSIFVEKFNHNRIAIHRSGLTKISKKFQYYYIGSNPGEKSFLIKPLQKAKDTFYSIPHGTSKVHNTKYFKNIKSVITPLLEKGIIKLAIKLKPLISIKRVGSSKKDVICTKW